MRVILADDSMLLREGLARLLVEAGFEVVGRAADGDELLALVDAHRPDVAIVDIRMPPTHTDEGLRAAHEIRARHPQTAIVILSEHVTTGDGIVTALALLDVMVRSGRPLSELAAAREVYPQTLINVMVEDPGAAKAIAASEAVRLAVSEAESALGEEGRVLLRPSGTEPVVRVMVEHSDETVCREVCEGISRAVYDAGKEGT